MNEEPKFRVWENHQKRYFYFQDAGITDKTLSFDCQEDDFDSSLFSWDSAKIEQYTGLKDKDGKEIYEGDIIKIIHLCWRETAIVEFRDGSFIFIVKDHDAVIPGYTIYRENWRLKVIGNINENPELLKC